MTTTKSLEAPSTFFIYFFIVDIGNFTQNVKFKEKIFATENYFNKEFLIQLNTVTVYLPKPLKIHFFHL